VIWVRLKKRIRQTHLPYESASFILQYLIYKKKVFVVALLQMKLQRSTTNRKSLKLT